ncbi:MAG: NPXTG-anchored protein [Firmicutes bacterium]|nr:NPXTG-anchored protein [Bacillota bacterium]
MGHKMLKHDFKRVLAFLLVFMMVFTSMPVTKTYAAEGDTSENPIIISNAEGLIAATEDKYYALGADINLTDEQQISTVVGVLDGRGYTVTLSGKALAANVTGTIQNLGLMGTVVENNKYSGSFAESFSGNLLNCYSTVKLSTSGWSYDHGGLVGTMSDGLIQNCYFAGTTTLCGGGIGGKGTIKDVGTAKNCYYTAGMDDFAMTPKPTRENVAKKTADELKANGVDWLNTDKPDTGYKWTVDVNTNGGLPILTLDDGSQTAPLVDKTSLQSTIESAQGYTESKYTVESWNSMKAALTNALIVFNNNDATQEEVDSAKTELETTLVGLVKIRITKPVEVPEEAIEISSQSDLKTKIEYPGTGKYYVLTKDITLDGMYFKFASDDFNGILDGQGHTITFNNAPALFHSVGVGEDAVIQNISFEGEIAAFTVSTSTGPLTEKSFKGSVINCTSNVTKGTGINNVAGFANIVDGGIISNCYVIGKATNAFANSFNSGKILNSYWMSGITNSVNENNVQNSSEMMASQMQTLDFVNLLNINKGEHGTKWGQNSNGFPYFGENKEYSQPGSGTYEYEMSFLPHNSNSESVVKDNQLTLLTSEVSNKFAGTFSVKDYTAPKNKKIIWSVTNTFPEGCVAIAEEEGEFYIYNAGEAIVRAQLADKDGNVEKTLVEVRVTTVTGTIEEIKLFIAGEEVTNGNYTIQGSEQKTIQVKAKYEGKEGFIGVTSAMFEFTTKDTDYLDTKFNYSTFCFKKPGNASIKVTSKDNANVTATVNMTSEYVAATKITPGVSGIITIHGRNANDWQNKTPLFNPIYNGVNIEPSNASYSSSDYWNVTSSDSNVGIYGETAYIPVGAGTVTYTATLSYVDPSGNPVVVSGSSDVTFKYENPLKEIVAEKDKIEVKNNTKTALSIIFTGIKEGWSISEPTIDWTYDKANIVEIYRDTEKDGFKRDESAYDNNMYVLGTDYIIKAVGEGTVVATGTPRDSSGGADPIKVTITVTKGENIPVVDIYKIVADGIESCIKYLSSKNIPYVYSSEWMILAQMRAGQAISDKNISDYLTDLNKEIAKWSSAKKPTDIERVSLTLTILGKDITDYNNKNLAEMIYNHPNLDSGSNELIYALIALDAAKVTPPSDAKWSKAEMIDKLLDFQNENGGFGLNSNASSDIDITAMALQALAPYQSNQEVKQASDKAIGFLKNEIDKISYGYGTAESNAQVILALATLNMDAVESGFGTKYENIFSHLIKNYSTEGYGFRHDTTKNEANNMATIQVLQSLEAYRRYMEEEPSYWDLTQKSVTYKTVIRLIDAIGNVTEASRNTIESARTAYDSLSDADKAKVTNYDILVAAEKKLESLKNPGKVENITSKDNDCYGSLEGSISELIDKLLTADEKKLVESGQNVKVSLSVKDIMNAISAVDKALIEKNLKNNKVGLYLDITLLKQIGNNDAVKIAETNGKVKVTIIVPDSLKNNDKSINRTYKIMRIHDGKVDYLDTAYDLKTGKLSFETDAFSTYALVYSDAPVIPKTGDSNNIGLMIGMMAMSLAVAVVIRRKNKAVK